MEILPLKAIPSQVVTITLGGQRCQIDVYQKRTGLFLDLYINNSLIVAGALCQDRNPVIRSSYLGFKGDLIFYDTQGTSDPTYDGIGVRYFLGHVTVGDLA